MELIPTAWSVISASMVFLLGALIGIKISMRFRVRQRRSLILYLWHTVVCFVYMFYVASSGGDALMYFDSSLHGSVDLALGTSVVLYITRLMNHGLGFSILGVFLVFNIVGFIGLLALDGALRYSAEGKSLWVRRTASALVFLPSISFWSSAIGKDAIAFASVGLALWAAIDMRRRFFLMMLAVALMLVVRPHMAVLLSSALAISVMLDSRVSIPRRGAMGIVAIAASVFLVPLAIGTSGLDSVGGIEAVGDYVEMRQGYNMDGGGGIDIGSMSLPMQMFSYLFRPLPFEANNIPSLAASLDNVILLGLFCCAGWGLGRGKWDLVGANWIFLLTYVLFSWVLLSSTTANLGISVRQKWMFVPMVIFILVSILGVRRDAGPLFRIR